MTVPRVLLLVNSLLGAGAEKSLRALQGPLAERGIATQMATLTDLGLSSTDQDVIALSSGYTGRRAAVKQVRAVIRSWAPDLVHTTLFEADLVGRLAARLERIPAVTSLVSTPYCDAARQTEPVHPVKLRAVQSLDQVLARYTTCAFHAISETVAQGGVAGLRVPRERITVVPRGRDPGLLEVRTTERRRRARTELGLDERWRLVLTVGREEPQKNHSRLVEAVSRLRKDRPDVVLAIAGRRGRSSAEIDGIAERSGLPAGALLRLGVRKDVPDLLAAADVFAFPSLWEGLGGAAIEAMAVGTPIVAGDVPALRELLVNGEVGLLADPTDPGALADAIHDTLANPESATERARRARRRFETHYTLAASADGMAEFYRSVLQRA